MDSKLPSSRAVDADYPLAPSLKMSIVERVFLAIIGGIFTAVFFTLFAIIAVIARFIWALAS
jgi:hypothetical protein